MAEKPTYEELEKKIQALEQTNCELRKSKRDYKTIVENIEDGYYEVDIAGNFTFHNDAMCKMLGYSKGELTGLNNRSFMDKANAKKIFNVFNRVYKTQQPYKAFDWELIKKDGSKCYIEVSVALRNDSNGQPIGFKGIARDITDRKHAEQALIDSENRWRNILVNIPQIGITLDTKAKIIFANTHFLKLTGWQKQEVIGQDWFDMFIPEQTRKEVRQEFLSVMSQKDTTQLSTYENEIIDRSGRLINVAWSNALTKDAYGKIIDVTCLGVDLTERQRAKQALQKSEAKFRSMLESMKDATYICSSELRIEYMNPVMIDKIGINATGKHCYKAIYDRDEQCPWCVLDQIKKGEHVDYEMTDPNSNHYYSVTSSPILHADRDASQFTILRDITEIKVMETHLQQTQKMESLGTLAGGVAHDFNNILFPIIGYSEMLLADIPEESPFRKGIKQIHAGALRASELIKQILIFSRQTNGEPKLIKMQLVVKEALKLIRSTIPATIKIQQDINPDCGVIKADPTQIHQIIMNLCTNAYHAMEKSGGELTVSLQQVQLIMKNGKLIIKGEDSGYINFDKHYLMLLNMTPGVYACLTVADTGVGIDNHLTDKIFDPFFTTKEVGTGTGMGLSVVHGVVKSMNGGIQVYSEPGKGAQFNVYLPLAEAAEEQHVKRVEEPIQGGNEHILLVDDEVAILEMESMMLERMGYKVTSHISSLEALKAFCANPEKFDLVITDMAMPDMSGEKLSVELAKIRPDIPLLLCTGFNETMSEEKAASLGIKGFLLKPIEMKDLACKIRTILLKE